VTARTGEVLGGLFFGHPQPGMFTERAERLVTAIAAQAAVAIDNVRLYQALQRELEARRQAEQDLRRINETLEQRAGERTRELMETERRFRLLVESVTDYAIYMLDLAGNVVNWNAGAQRIKGYAREEVLGQHFSRFYTDEDRALEVPARALATAATSGKYETEGWRVRKDGSRFWASVVINAIHDGEGELIGFAKVTRDLTERRAGEEQLRQVQKMESVGQLTGGVAHDFNNLLTVIIGNLDALQRHLREPTADMERLKRSAENAMRGARRGESLTQRLLAFSRQQMLKPEILDVNQLVRAAGPLLRRTLGEAIDIRIDLAADLRKSRADASQIENALINLAVNARDAMSTGGTLTIRTANVTLHPEAGTRVGELKAGAYVTLAVSDTGTGMPPEVRDRAFEPFFTTKEVGKGTGLGLSMVYGFAQQSGGHVVIDSEVGKGTTITIYLAQARADSDETEADEIQSARGAGETVLLVEDETDVRDVMHRLLSDLGYKVIVAPNGEAALAVTRTGTAIDLVLTDVVMPGGVDGWQLAQAVWRERDRVPVLFVTGYTDNPILQRANIDERVRVLTKPVRRRDLAAALRGTIGSDAA
jgi:PAS domain S-box-containing protein